MALTRRNIQAALDEPVYEFEDVPRCKRDLEGSCMVRITDRSLWLKMLGELLLVCNEAALRFEQRCKTQIAKLKEERRKQLAERHIPDGQGVHEAKSDADKKTNGCDGGGDDDVDIEIPYELVPIHTGKPLSLEYMADRLDLDDPLSGYVVRTLKEGWLQGFVTISTFTSWQRWFRWDSMSDEAGLLMFDTNGSGMDAMHSMGMHSTDQSDPSTQWWMDRWVDGTGELAAALNAEIRDGDPDGEGVIWPHVAELSLLGGLGCGGALVKLVLDELESTDSPYHYVVLQATENSVPFYESQGFIRVGAIARYFQKPEQRSSSKSATSSQIPVPIPMRSPTRTVDHHPRPSFFGEDTSTASNSSRAAKAEQGQGKKEEEEEGEEKEVTVNTLQPRSKRNGSSGLTRSRARTNDKKTSNMDHDEADQDDDEEMSSMTRDETPGKRRILPRRVSMPRSLSTPPPGSLKDSLHADSESSVDHLRDIKPDTMTPEVPEVRGACSRYEWHKVNSGETPTCRDLARKFGILASDLVFLNRRLYSALRETSKLIDGTMMRIPRFPDFIDPLEHRPPQVAPAKSAATHDLVKNDSKLGRESSNGLWYQALDNESPRMIANRLGLDVRKLIQINARTFPNLNITVPLIEGTVLRLPRRCKPFGPNKPEIEEMQQDWGIGHDDANLENLTEVMTYRHWSFSDDPVDMSVASYMMVRPLVKRKPGAAPSAIAELAQKRSGGVNTVPPQWAYGAGDVNGSGNPSAVQQVDTTVVNAKPEEKPAEAAKQDSWGDAAKIDADGDVDMKTPDGAANVRMKEKPPAPSQSKTSETPTPASTDPTLKAAPHDASEASPKAATPPSDVVKVEKIDGEHRDQKSETKEAKEKEEEEEEEQEEEEEEPSGWGFDRHIKVRLYSETLATSTVDGSNGGPFTARDPSAPFSAFDALVGDDESGEGADEDGNENDKDEGMASSSKDDGSAMRTRSGQKVKLFSEGNLKAKVFLAGSPYIGRLMHATLSRPLQSPVPELKPPIKPRRPLTAYMQYNQMERDTIKQKYPDADFATLGRLMGEEWKALSETQRSVYVQRASEDRLKYDKAMAIYKQELQKYQEATNGGPSAASAAAASSAAATVALPPSNGVRSSVAVALNPLIPAKQQRLLVNQVVRLESKTCSLARKHFLGHLDEEKDHVTVATHCKTHVRLDQPNEYFFVLTYIPDLFWARLAPMQQSGVFEDSEAKYAKHRGRSKWVLVPEGQAQEIDVSAQRCVLVKSCAVKRTADADNEEWDLHTDVEIKVSDQARKRKRKDVKLLVP
ncbi:High mobility group protein [Hondaea fermentalgiana]|uniref:High mobility group protein n=1 Tax=Hondaea fermentalgiana TaxID=2315210 RepID=A0A2R5G248_9STRA|nr:High mobility group protein [Hondaea fermentalgiana]|eukprot:GBG25086.1 High mobility group protein [Hondaea fermentalgiana]